MIHKIKKYGKYICLGGVMLVITLQTACGNSDDNKTPTISYGPEVGFAGGNVDLSGDNPIVDISNIKSPVGENIDFLSGVVIANEDSFSDLEVWADASLVDIFTPGNYKATYTFNYNGKSITKDITVTIFEPETEPSASETIGNGGTTIQQTSSSNTTSPASTPGLSENNTTYPNVSSENNTTDTNVSSENNTTTSGSSSGNNATTPANQATTIPQATTTPQAASSTREIITTKGNSTTESKNIGNYTIELLSGKTITIKNTTSKYIVSTRTDISTITRNGKNYRVSKLIITYNTGAEQVLETLEERIK